jgi:hypothetical protein
MLCCFMALPAFAMAQCTQGKFISAGSSQGISCPTKGRKQ